jgi:Crp-like helix-turn-helix protein
MKGSASGPSSIAMNATRTRRRSSTFSFERVLDTADGVLNLALYLVGLALASSLAPTALPDVCLTTPLISFADPATRSLSMTFSFTPASLALEAHPEEPAGDLFKIAPIAATSPAKHDCLKDGSRRIPSRESQRVPWRTHAGSHSIQKRFSPRLAKAGALSGTARVRWSFHRETRLLLLANFGKEGKPEPVIAKISQETLAEMIGTTRSRVSFFMNKFRQLGFIHYNGGIEVHSSLLNVVLHDQPQIKT